MADIELIPADYVTQRKWRRRLQRMALAMGLLVVATASGRAWIAWRLSLERPAVEAMKQSERAANARRSSIASLQASLTAAQRQLASMRELRDGADWETIFRAVDAAYNPGFWLEGLDYSRDVQVLPPASPTAAATPAVAPAPRIRFEIQGHALNHPAITNLMHGIGMQPGIAGVRLTETTLRRQASVDVVEFKLSGTIDAKRRANQ